MATDQDTIFALGADFIERLISDREHLHRKPELSLMEHRTAEYIQDRLEDLGLEVMRIGETGVVGVIRNGDGPVLAYRADTDALPMKEKTGLPFASREKCNLNGTEVSVMHACGHDVHMAVALGTAGRLVEYDHAWSGTALFIFQPAEEIGVGAKALVDAGLWSILPRPEVVLGMHVMPHESGKVLIPVGPAMSMADSWRITIFGRGSHGSQPEESIDPIVIGASIIVRLQTVVSREVSPRDIAVVTVGTFHAGLKENIIPDKAEFSVNVRTFDPTVREKVLSAIRRIVIAEAAASGAPEPRFETISSFPQCYNEPEEARLTLSHMRTILGDEAVSETPPHMASEDFGYLGQSISVPSVFWFLGGTPAKDIGGNERVPVNHSPYFAPVTEPTLEKGVVAALAAMYYRFHLRQ